MYYLYLKTHNKTGLKYLGQTIQDPYHYKGSGVYWQRHISKHGYDASTQILLATSDKEDISNTGLYFSKLWNIVESTRFANLCEESGTGAGFGMDNPMYGKKRNHSTATKLKLSKSNAGENNNMYGKTGHKHPFYGKNIVLRADQIQERNVY